MTYRFATQDDIPVLAEMNERLARDENHRDRLTIASLQSRLTNWRAEGQRADVSEVDGTGVAYALISKTPDHK